MSIRSDRKRRRREGGRPVPRRRTLALLAPCRSSPQSERHPYNDLQELPNHPARRYGSVCCTGTSILDCSYSDIADGSQTPTSSCPPGAFGRSLPLLDAEIAAAKANGRAIYRDHALNF
ncbi:hypothetical protein B0H13DRAFT_2384849 [Mycena leptocephala]|nr:hypothetical protein B0H13DRAFT_2384849 [Mycena leptocephala]